MFDNLRGDFRAHGCKWGAQGFWAMTIYRYGRWAHAVRWAIVRKPLSLIYQILFKWIQIVAGIELPCHVPVGPNFVIDHSGGIVISGYARFGANCRIRTGVVVGLSRVSEPTAPWIGDNVDIGAGAKLLGGIRIGNNVVIGANAVVVRDVPDNHVAVGIPATCRPRRS